MSVVIIMRYFACWKRRDCSGDQSDFGNDSKKAERREFIKSFQKITVSFLKIRSLRVLEVHLQTIKKV